MNPRKTTTGKVLEDMILPALKYGGYTYQKQVLIGQRPGGSKHIVDIVAQGPDGRKFLISLKWQQVSGTAEQKVPFEVICLAEAILRKGEEYHGAYLVLGGDGWTLRDFYMSGELQKHLRYGHLVEIVALEQFIRLANQGKL